MEPLASFITTGRRAITIATTPERRVAVVLAFLRRARQRLQHLEAGSLANAAMRGFVEELEAHQRATEGLISKSVSAEGAAIVARMEALLEEAETKAIDAMGRYKFQVFSYWAAIWVHLNKIEGKRRPNPFRHIVLAAREVTP